MTRSAWTTFRDWAGLIASAATVLFLALSPHGPSPAGSGSDAYRTAMLDRRAADKAAGAATAALIDPADAHRR